MGYDFTFYALRETDHQSDKTYCLGWEYEPDRDEQKEQMCEKYGIEESNKNRMMFHIVVPEWCERCAMFIEASFPKNWILDTIGFHHSYSNPIVMSNWFFNSLGFGTGNTDFCKRFSPDHEIHEILLSDINFLKDRLQKNGTPYRKVDREALEETHEVIAFCETWLNKENVRLIYTND